MEGTHRKPSHISQTLTESHNNNSHSNMQYQQLHEAQKVEALKKAYAEVILNTGKEAAARVMASERRAVQYRHELESTKDEALRMLMRLKQMLDAKTAEAEAASLNQQRKIEELEAQLNEAEDVITDLRAELNQVWFELEKTRNSQVQSSDGQCIKQNASFEESAKFETSVPSPNEKLERPTSCDMKNRSLAVDGLDDKCCNSTLRTEQLCASNSEKDNAHDPEFASIIVRSKEPELSKNGCTQRVRALEGNLLDEKLLDKDEHNQQVGVKNGLIVKDGDEQIAKFSAPSIRTVKMEMKKNVKCHTKPKRKVFSYCRSCFLSFHRVHIDEKWKSNKGACSLPSTKHYVICKWKGKNRRHRHVRMGSSISEHQKPFVLKKCTSHFDDGKRSDDENVAKIKPVLPLTDTETVHGSINVLESNQVVSKSELVEKAIEKDNELLNLEGTTSQNLTGPSSSMKVVIVDLPCTNSILEKPKAFEENDGSPSRADNRTRLKYTFQRKRKRESLGNPDEQTDSKSMMKRRVEEICSYVLEPPEI